MTSALSRSSALTSGGLTKPFALRSISSGLNGNAPSAGATAAGAGGTAGNNGAGSTIDAPSLAAAGRAGAAGSPAAFVEPAFATGGGREGTGEGAGCGIPD